MGNMAGAAASGNIAGSIESDPIDYVPHNLLAGDTASNDAAPVASDALIAQEQTLLDQARMDLNLTQGEVTMFIPDMPNVPPQNVPVLIAQANQAQAGDVTTIRTIGVCHPAPSNAYSLENVTEPIGEADYYLQQYEQQTVTGSATITILQQPKHGILRLVTEADRGTLFSDTSGPIDPADPGYAYLPEEGYLGKDKAIVLVEIGGVKVKVVYFFQAIEGGLGNTGLERLCSKTGYHWKISSTIDANGNSTITSVEYQSPTIDAGATTTDTATLASTLGASILSSHSVDPSLITLNIADLPGGAVGQTVGTNGAANQRINGVRLD
jgi:hypothetical protein